MPEREPKLPTVSPTEAVSSAPELPITLVKQYGLHHRASKRRAPAPTGADEVTTTTETDVAPALETAEDVPELAVLTDPKTDAAVDSIVATESDELLAAEDALQHAHAAPEAPKRSFWGRVGHFFKVWATNPRARWATVITLFLLTVAGTMIPSVRYYALNTAGVRSAASVTVVDNSTRLPLKNVTVRIGDQKAQTDINGRAKLIDLKLGPQPLVVERLAFETIRRQVTVGWGSNPQDTLLLAATGLQYVIEVRDYVSTKPLADVEVVADGLNAISDKKGIVTLTVSDRDPKEMAATVNRKGYRSEKLSLKPAQAQVGKVHLVPSGKVFYVSKQGGSYDLYSTDVDGARKKVILPGTGNESNNISLAASPAGDWAAIVSTRDTIRSKDGYLLRSITLVNQEGSTVSMLERAEQIQLIGWVGTKVIYQVTVAGASAANSQRSRLISYDYTTNNRIQLATANQFNAVHVIKDTAYYAVASSDPAVQASFNKIRLDGTGKQTVWEKEVWTAWRTGYATLRLQTSEGWFTYAGSGVPTAESTVPSNGRLYVDDADGSATAWVDVRDGKGVVIVAGSGGGSEKQVASADGLTYPVRWLNSSTIVYRVVSNSETADYVVSTAGGQPRKVSDVTNAYGFTRY